MYEDFLWIVGKRGGVSLFHKNLILLHESRTPNTQRIIKPDIGLHESDSYPAFEGFVTRELPFYIIYVLRIRTDYFRIRTRILPANLFRILPSK